MENMPKDPVMLMSFVNTKLRDHYASIKDFCDSEGVSESELKEKLESAGFSYNAERRQFV